MSKDIIVKTYKGTQQKATAAFQKDAAQMSAQGYTPISQVWTPGAYGCGEFLVALLLCIVIIGILIFIYMVIVKPPGTLTVTYSAGEKKAFVSRFEKETPPPPLPEIIAPPKTWRVSKDGHDLGSLDLPAIKLMLKTKKLSPEDLYYDDSLNDWIALSLHEKL